MSQVEQFARVASDFCIWAEGEAAAEAAEAQTARKLLIELYRTVLRLPETGSHGEAPSIPQSEWMIVFKRFGSLPFSYYSECFNPLAVPPEEPVVADLADDLADIWRDLKSGLLLYERGDVAGAVWEWRFAFHSHWGHHLTAAIYALQSWFSQHDEPLLECTTKDETAPEPAG